MGIFLPNMFCCIAEYVMTTNSAETNISHPDNLVHNSSSPKVKLKINDNSIKKRNSVAFQSLRKMRKEKTKQKLNEKEYLQCYYFYLLY